MRKAILFPIFILVAFQIFAQERIFKDDTLSLEYSIAKDTLKFEKLDYYNLNHFQQYRPFGTSRLPLARSGNLGLPLHNFKFQFQDWTTDYILGGYTPYLFTKDSMRYYKMSRPFTQLNYANGSESEQLFQIFHSQNLGEGLNISFEYRRITSEGFYIRQLTNHTQFNSTYNLKSRNGKFRSRGYFLINDIEAQENGGIIISENEEETDNTVLLDVNLREAQNQSRTQGVGTRNEYDFLSLDSTTVLLNFSHELDWNKSYRNYSDDVTNSPNYYQNYFFDTIKSVDTSFAQTLSNEFFANFLNRQINVGFRNEQLHYFQNTLIDEKFTSNYILAEIKGSLFNLNVESILEKGISGFHRNELDWKTTADFEEFLGLKSQFIIHQTRKQPDYFQGNQRTNHFVINNSFETSNYSGFLLKTKVEKYKLLFDLGWSQFSNYIYIDSLLIPRQSESSISSFHVEVHKKFEFLKHWNLMNKIRFQTISEEEIVPLPNLVSYHSLYYENRFLKKTLLFQIGVDVYYIGENKGYQYSPSLAQFHLRNADSDLGNILQVDLFVNMGINKSARIFVKMENSNSNSFSEESYRIQDYPVPGKALKVGLSWRMIN